MWDPLGKQVTDEEAKRKEKPFPFSEESPGVLDLRTLGVSQGLGSTLTYQTLLFCRFLL